MPGIRKARGKCWLLVLPPQAPERLRKRIEKAVAARQWHKGGGGPARGTTRGIESFSRHGQGFKAAWRRVSTYKAVYSFFFVAFAKAKPRMTATFRWSIAVANQKVFPERGKHAGRGKRIRPSQKEKQAVAKAISKKASKRLPRPSQKKRPAAFAAHKDASEAGHAVARAGSAKHPAALATHQGSAEAGQAVVIAEPRAATLTLPLREKRPVLVQPPPLSSRVAWPTSCAPSRAASSVAPEAASASDDLLLKMMSLRRRHPDIGEAKFHNTYNVLEIGSEIVRRSSGDVFFTSNPVAKAVAIKTWQADRWEAALTEVTMMQRCRHPHIVPLLDAFVGRAFRLVCVHGGDDLESHIGRGCQGESWTLPRKASLLLTIENMSCESIYLIVELI